MKYNNLYYEREKYGNGFRKTYKEGLENLLEALQEKSLANRKNYDQKIRLHPEQFRQIVKETLGWPLTEENSTFGECRMNFVSKDDLSSIYRVQLEVQPGLFMYGILFLKDETKRLPLVIVQHGGLGAPEFCSGFFDSENYNDMTRRILANDVHVFCPQLYLWSPERFGKGPEGRKMLDQALKHIGSSIAAVEIDGLQKYIDWLTTLPCVSSEAIGMIGLSYGGFYTLYMAAIDERIKAALSSCYFNDKVKYNWTDWTWSNSGNLFMDAEIGALVYPRKLWIQVADNDELFYLHGAETEFERLQEFYKEKSKNLNFEIFPGVHEFAKSEDGILFVTNELKKFV